MIWTFIGIGAAALTTFAFVPQIIKATKTKCVEDFSLVTLLQLSLGVSLWVVYGVYLKNVVIIVANSVTLVSLIALLFFYFSFKKENK
ncbi:MAG: SemiSWEET transporter [Candidatus Omnitrophica bacterium]|nr:SemiSWEET transporter [Candidatus Omnitrophota bacterium]MDD5236204.1 SemiSWEET transporter [Candidatus Omnitrophota bacterium]MDD5610165.1 SemiSWEET transporter [Candidatus Omnitrophota bacterium]